MLFIIKDKDFVKSLLIEKTIKYISDFFYLHYLPFFFLKFPLFLIVDFAIKKKLLALCF